MDSNVIWVQKERSKDRNKLQELFEANRSARDIYDFLKEKGYHVYKISEYKCQLYFYIPMYIILQFNESTISYNLQEANDIIESDLLTINDHTTIEEVHNFYDSFSDSIDTLEEYSDQYERPYEDISKDWQEVIEGIMKGIRCVESIEQYVRTGLMLMKTEIMKMYPFLYVESKIIDDNEGKDSTIEFMFPSGTILRISSTLANKGNCIPYEDLKSVYVAEGDELDEQIFAEVDVKVGKETISDWYHQVINSVKSIPSPQIIDNKLLDLNKYLPYGLQTHDPKTMFEIIEETFVKFFK